VGKDVGARQLSRGHGSGDVIGIDIELGRVVKQGTELIIFTVP
jgi:hypothetical protein